MKDIVEADYGDLDVTGVSKKVVVTFIDGEVVTFTDLEDIKAVMAKMREQQGV